VNRSKLLLDLQCLQYGPLKRPVARILRGLTEALISGSSEGEISVMLNLVLEENFEEVRQWIESRLPRERIRLFRGLTGVRASDPSNANRARVCQALYDAYVGLRPTDLVLAASTFEGFKEDTTVGGGALAASGLARAALVHHLIKEPELHFLDPVQRDWYCKRLSWLSELDLVLTNSEYVRKTLIELAELAPNRIVNISFDIEPEFRAHALPSANSASLLLKHEITAPFIMHPCGPDPCHSIEAVLRALGYLPAEMARSHKVVLIVTATEEQKRQIRAVARKIGISARQLVLPEIDTIEGLAALYAGAHAVVVGTDDEGLNLRLLEAMRCGAPVLAVNEGSLPELIGNPELMFDGDAPSALALKLKSLLSDEGMRQRAVAHGIDRAKCFSWTGSATRAREAFAEAVKRRRGTKHPAPNRSFIVVPPHELAGDRPRLVCQLAAELRNSGPVIIAARASASAELELPLGTQRVDPSEIDIGDDKRVVIVAGREGPDAVQRDVLAAMPAVALLLEEERAGCASPEMLYHLGGYRAVLDAARSRVVDAPYELLMAHPNLLGVIREATELPTRIETVYANHPLGVVPRLVKQIGVLQEADAAVVATTIAENHACPTPPRLLVDISELVLRDIKTGVQRVVRAVLKYLLTEPCGRRVEPVYRDRHRHVYRYARRFTCQFLNLPPLGLDENVVDFRPSDVFFGLDVDKVDLVTGKAPSCWRELHRRGGRVCVLVHDLLSITHPDWFPRGNQATFAKWFRLIATEADQLIAVSRVVADEIFERVERLRPPRTRPLDITWSHNGSDLGSSAPTQGISCVEASAFQRLKGQTVFLTVGTIEPRKGLSQLLDGAQILWREGELAFVLVGRRGWNLDELIGRVETHPELGRRLFWFDSVSDEVLDRLYGIATAAVLPSEGEGFGLPLVEAARHKTPIIARNLPVFREIGGDGAFYFDAETGEDLAAALRRWLDLNAAHKAPSPEKIVCLTWQESTRQLLDTIDGRRPYRRWFSSRAQSSNIGYTG
jgi:glycosyltransferase involved in cell wall biosynthesis